MITTLPAGTYIRFRYHGGWDYGCILAGQTHFQLIQASQIPSEVEVHECVWKKDDELISRRILKPRRPRFGDDLSTLIKCTKRTFPGCGCKGWHRR